MQSAREGIVTPQIQTVAEKELRPVEFILNIVFYIG